MRHESSRAVCRFPSFTVWLVVVACLAALALATPPALAAEDQQQKGLALIARAAQLENLLAPDVGPFHLRVHVKLLGLTEGTRAGEFLLMAASQSQWFETVRFPGYTELTGVLEGQSWRKRNVIDKPFRFHEVSKLLDLTRHLRLPVNVEISKLTQKDIRGVQAFCIEASPTIDLWQRDAALKAAITPVGTSKDSQVTLCFDPATGGLMSATYSSSLPRFEYEGQVTLGNKAFPKVLRCYEANNLAVEATVVELAAEQNAEPTGFAIPAGAEKWPTCDSPEVPQQVKKQSVGHPSNAKVRKQFGTVVCLAEIGIDGQINNLSVVQWRSGFIEAIQEAVKSWRYTPATCNGVPVPAEIYLSVTFPP